MTLSKKILDSFKKPKIEEIPNGVYKAKFHSVSMNIEIKDGKAYIAENGKEVQYDALHEIKTGEK